MTRLNTYQEFICHFESPWVFAGETVHRWSQSFYTTGSIDMTDADAETTGRALAAPALSLASVNTSLIGLTYYKSGSVVSDFTAEYAPGAHPGTGNGYVAASGAPAQLEVAALARCPIGRNSRGKEVYLRKWFHDVEPTSTDPNSIRALADPTALLAVFNEGAGPHEVRPVSPATGVAGGPWTIETHLYTHQLRKGKKRRVVAGSSVPGSVLHIVQDLLTAKGLAATLEELAALL